MAVGFKNKNKEKSEVVVKTLNIRPIRRGTQDIESWRSALKAAEGVNKNRTRLLELYADVVLDGRVKDNTGKRVKAITNLDLKFFDKEGKEVVEISELMETPQGQLLLEEIVNSIFWGYSLISLEEWQTANSKSDEDSKTVLIDRRHVKPEFGQVVRESSDTEGLDYNEKPYIDFVVRAGKEDDLGLFLQVAQYVTYKRGGFGDYAEFVEVFGMPFRKATYQNEEDKIILDQMLKEAGAAGYATVPEGVEITQDYVNVQGGGALHDGFRKACNEEISVTILGQTETTTASNSSGYAQSKTHADVLQEIHEDDRQFTLRILNKELNRVLIALGYNAVGTWRFIDQETISLSERITIDTQVAQIVPVDDDYFYEKYNVPKPANYEQLKKEKKAKLKAQTEAMQKAAKDNEKKKKEEDNKNLADFHRYLENKDKTLFDKIKSFFFDKKIDLNDYYNSSGCGCTPEEIQLNEADITKAFEAFAKEVYEGKITRRQLHQGLYNETAKELISSLLEGYGRVKVDYKSPDNVMQAHLKSNIFAFSGAKNFEEYEQCRDLLFNEDGKLKPFNKYRDDVLEQVNEQYNVNYLKTEYRTAEATSRAASNEMKFQRDKDIFPYATFVTSGDSKVRPSHKKFDGFTAKIDDPIWNKITPPIDYNDRCSKRQSREPNKNNPKISNRQINQTVPKQFRNNPGVSKMVFDENNHPYFVDTDFKKVDLNAVKNYQLPTTRSMTGKAKTAFKSSISNANQYAKWYDDKKNKSGDISFIDPLKTHIAFTNESYKKGLAKKNFDIAGAIDKTISSPDEVYSLHHEGTRRKSTKLTQRYIKFFIDKVVIIDTIEDNGIITIKEFYELENLNDDSYRSGVLVYRK